MKSEVIRDMESCFQGLITLAHRLRIGNRTTNKKETKMSHNYNATLLRKTSSLLIAGIASLTFAMAKPADTSVIQSPARPFGLEIVNKVEATASDAASKDFRSGTLAQIAKLAAQNPSADNSIERSAVRIDPTKLRLATSADVRMYFVAEDTAYANTLGFTTDGTGSVKSKTAELIFPNASTGTSGVAGRSDVKRTAAEPLLPGDFVRMGTLDAGTQLDFFMIANGANGGTKTYSNQPSANSDGLSHMLAYTYTFKDSAYLVLAFDDSSSNGDRSFSDLIVALDIGLVNVAALTATPEPATYATMGLFLGIGGLVLRRNRKATH